MQYPQRHPVTNQQAMLNLERKDSTNLDPDLLVLIDPKLTKGTAPSTV